MARMPVMFMVLLKTSQEEDHLHRSPGQRLDEAMAMLKDYGLECSQYGEVTHTPATPAGGA